MSVTLLLAALADALGGSVPVNGFSAVAIRETYLNNAHQTGDRRAKLVLSKTDATTLRAIVDQAPLPDNHSVRVVENHALFAQWLKEGDQTVVEICKGLAKLMIVDVRLERGKDNPQLVFESMNSTGKELSQADLIRNFILMGLELDLQTKLYEQYWR